MLARSQTIVSIICVGSFRNHTHYGLGAETLPLDASSVTVWDCLRVYGVHRIHPFILQAETLWLAPYL